MKSASASIPRPLHWLVILLVAATSFLTTPHARAGDRPQLHDRRRAAGPDGRDDGLLRHGQAPTDNTLRATPDGRAGGTTAGAVVRAGGRRFPRGAIGEGKMVCGRDHTGAGEKPEAGQSETSSQ